LTNEEWGLLRMRPVIAARILADTGSLVHLVDAIRAEHERWDGGGYPDGLRGDQIPLSSRITLACDAYHAMTSERPYSPAMSPARALSELRRNAGTQFDPNVVGAFVSAWSEHEKSVASTGGNGRGRAG